MLHEMTPFLPKSISDICDHFAILKFLWLHNHHGIYIQVIRRTCHASYIVSCLASTCGSGIIYSKKQRRIVHRVHTQCSLHWTDSRNTREFSGYSTQRLITQNEGDVLRWWNKGVVPAVATINTQSTGTPEWNQDCQMVSPTVRFISLRKALLLQSHGVTKHASWQHILQGCSDGLDLYMCAPSCRHPLRRPHSPHMHVTLAQAHNATHLPSNLCQSHHYKGVWFTLQL